MMPWRCIEFLQGLASDINRRSVSQTDCILEQGLGEPEPTGLKLCTTRRAADVYGADCAGYDLEPLNIVVTVAGLAAEGFVILVGRLQNRLD